MKKIIVLFGINVCGLLSAMEKDVVQKPYCITVYSVDNQRTLVPLELMRESNVLYEQYCKKVKDEEERLFLDAPIYKKEIEFFVEALAHKKNTNFKNYYHALEKSQQKQLFDIAAGLKSSKLNMHIIDSEILAQNVKDYISALAMPMQQASQSIRYCKIKTHAQISPLCSETCKDIQLLDCPTPYTLFSKEKKIDGDTVIMSPDGKRKLTFVSEWNDQKYDTMILWEFANDNRWHPIKTMAEENGPIIKAFFNPAGDRILALTYDGGWCLLYDGYTGDLIMTENENMGHDIEPENCYCEAIFSDDSKFFIKLMFYRDDWSQSDYWHNSVVRLFDGKWGGRRILDFWDDISRQEQGLRSYRAQFTPALRGIIDVDLADGVHYTDLYTDEDEKEIEQIAQYKPVNLCDAYAVWRACKAAEHGDEYDGECLSDEIKKIITASVVKQKDV